MRFALHPLRLTLEALDAIHFPQGKAGNVLRGALGHALEEGIFRPKLDQGPSGFADPPRPFVFRVRALEGRTFLPGEQFTIEMNVFDRMVVASIVEALATMAAAGFGPGRGRAILTGHDQHCLEVDLRKPDAPLQKAGILFLTPTEIKGNNGHLLREPEFGTLMARIRDRISALRALYGEGPLDMDFRAFALRASKIRMTAADLRRTSIERLSTRTGQRHPLGGFTGGATYEGELGEFAPYLHAAAYTGVGRQTVWGKGEIALHRLE
ncbi:MAG: CRISPR system precrRNA processing endoribonuclease RAMP protein Cas6 [Bryobacterales bacterium]|nr:CRISPR system precrRNA processing endoribonuclease RAMP protein Cas6 [Bryobacterales bacterium]